MFEAPSLNPGLSAEPVESDDTLIALTESRAADLVGVRVETLRRWAEDGLVGATVVRRLSPRNTVRLYGFDDLVALLVLKELREVKSHQAVRVILGRLRSEYARPLAELRFAVDASAGHVYFQHPDGSWEGDDKPRQTVLEQVLDLRAIKASIRAQAHGSRRPDEIAVVDQRRRRMGGKPVFGGSRIPLDTVREYVIEGVEDAEILQAFPRLTEADLQLARKGLVAG